MNLDDHIQQILWTDHQISQQVSLLASQITRDFQSPQQPPVFLGVANGALLFLADLVRKIPLPITLDFIRVDSYGSATVSNGRPTISMDLKLDVRGKHVVLVEDIVDTGSTLSCLINHLKSKGVSSVSVCTLLDKPARRKVHFELVGEGKYYSGFECPDHFVVGYGLDFGELYRNLPYIGVLKPEIYKRKMPSKRVSSKEPVNKRQKGVGASSQKPQPSSISNQEESEPNFDNEEKKKTKYEIFLIKNFSENRYIDWEVLEKLQIASQVKQLLSVGAWRPFFDIIEPSYKKLTAEFMATFKMEVENINWESQVMSFQMLGHKRTLSITEFSIAMGLYDREYTATKEYKDLPLGMPENLAPETFWQTVSDERRYSSSSSKATHLNSCILRFIHAVLSHSLTIRGQSTGVVNRKDLTYLWSMVERTPIHVGFALAHMINHQATDPRVGTIGIGPYVTRLAKYLGLINVLDEPEHRKMVPIGFEILHSMKMIEKHVTTEGIVYNLVGVGAPQQQIVEPNLVLNTTTSERGESSATQSSDNEQIRIEIGELCGKVDTLHKDVSWGKSALQCICLHFGISVPDEMGVQPTTTPTSASPHPVGPTDGAEDASRTDA